MRRQGGSRRRNADRRVAVTSFPVGDVGNLSVRFHGVRGSTPCEGPRFERFGGHTSCVELTTPGEEPLVLDLGTGVKSFGEQLVSEGSCNGGYHANVLLTHLHWDHVQGLPFFEPLFSGGQGLDIYGPVQPEGHLEEVFSRFMGPPFFPITIQELAAAVTFHDTTDDDFAIGGAKVRSRGVRHNGPTLGFRIEQSGCVVAYIPDHGPGCSPDDADDYIPTAVLELCDGADVVIHDAQYTRGEFETRRTWGHCTVDYAVHVAAEAGARTLALFHHDPYHDDPTVDTLLRYTQDLREAGRLSDILAASEGTALELTRETVA